RIHPVVGGEAGVDVDGEPTVGPLLHVRGQLRGLRQVADVTDGRGHVIAVPQVSHDGAGLGGRLDDHESAGGGGGGHVFLSPVLTSTLSGTADPAAVGCVHNVAPATDAPFPPSHTRPA